MNFGLLFAVASALTSPTNYIFAPFRSNTDAANWIDGRIMGAGADYRYVRAEDVAWICEGWSERKCLNDGSMPVAPFWNIVSNRVIRKAEFPFTYGRWPIMPGYVRVDTNLTFQTGLYRIESGAAVAERVAKLNGDWCELSNVYWRVNYSNRLERALTLTNIVNNFRLLALATTLEKENLSRVDRTQGGKQRQWREYVDYYQISDTSFGWMRTGYPMSITTNSYTGGDEYYCTVTGEKKAEVGAIRDSSQSSGWLHGLSPPVTSYFRTDNVQTGACQRVCFTLATDSSLVTTGGVTRFQSVDLYVPLVLAYSRSLYTHDENGGSTVSTNVSQRYIYTFTGATIDLNGATAKAYASLDGATVAAAALADLGLPAPEDFALSELATAHMYGSDDSGWYSSSQQETREVTLNVSGNAVAIIGCAFATSPP